MRTRGLAVFAGMLLAGSLIAAPAPAPAPLKTLTAEEQVALRAGQGMGLARAAELNGYPGPRHVLELATELGLTAAQREESQALFDRMLSAARDAGEALIDEERRLDALYASNAASREVVDAQLARIEAVRTRLRGVHLHTHLEQAALLTPQQIARYAELRGIRSAHSHHSSHQDPNP